ncbi:hypothetical protein GCM10022221_42130 [Actinocorallia aurea]
MAHGAAKAEGPFDPAAAQDVARAAAEADAALAAGLALLEPAARRIEGADFTGWLRGPADAPATVVVDPGPPGGPEAARGFAEKADLTELAPRITVPLLVVDGGEDVIFGVTNGAPLAEAAPRGDTCPSRTATTSSATPAPTGCPTSPTG